MNKACEQLAQYTNAFQEKLEFKREVIADRGYLGGKEAICLECV